MQLSSEHQSTPSASYRPGIGFGASHRHRTLELGDGFTGLEPGFSRFDLLLLAKRAGPEAGITPKMLQLLEYYLTVFTRDIDWEQGRPIVYQSLAKTALDLGVSERQVQKLEKQLFDAGAIGYVDSGNCRRYGRRDPATGVIEYAFGVDLSPLAHLRPQLEERLHAKQEYNRDWQATKRAISSLRRRIRRLLTDWREQGADVSQVACFERAYEPMALQLRTHIRLEQMRTLLERHHELRRSLLKALGAAGSPPSEQGEAPSQPAATAKRSCANAATFAHYQYNNQSIQFCSRDDLGCQGSKAAAPEATDPISSSGLPHVTLAQARRAASSRLRELLPMDVGTTSWEDLVLAADALRIMLGIAQTSWGAACQVLGRTGAAVCLLITDRAALRIENRVRQPAAYFRGMINRARAGELRLHHSIFGLLDKGVSEWACPLGGDAGHPR